MELCSVSSSVQHQSFYVLLCDSIVSATLYVCDASIQSVIGLDRLERTAGPRYISSPRKDHGPGFARDDHRDISNEKTDIAPPATAGHPNQTHSADTTSNEKRLRKSQTTLNGLNRSREGMMSMHQYAHYFKYVATRDPSSTVQDLAPVHWSSEQTIVYEELLLDGLLPRLLS
ncbi:hypothetical protein LTR48_000336 [Friedmanniomyces endolithicus]|uniref:Uncharacterized protein n=1 Tax=Rachicladosporium monterosium TaxID=1507873 RepID=A0ABR0L843_9PEZI|nr:hypothetical protein LTR48_000336 [Friedmanniomyces endolithicus]KAK5144914.1 hypothetical protein LTR32_003243 [Rachicladosporium monterosium]